MEIFANTTFSKVQKAVYPPFFFWKHFGNTRNNGLLMPLGKTVSVKIKKMNSDKSNKQKRLKKELCGPLKSKIYCIGGCIYLRSTISG